MAVVLSMTGIYNGLFVDALTIARAPNADLWVVETGTNGPFAEASRIPGGTRQIIVGLHGVADAGGITYQAAEADFLGNKLRLNVVGYQLGRPGAPENLLKGRYITVVIMK